MATDLVFDGPASSGVSPLNVVFGENDVEVGVPFSFTVDESETLTSTFARTIGPVQLFYLYNSTLVFKVGRKFAQKFTVAEQSAFLLDHISTSNGAIFTIAEASTISVGRISSNRSIKTNALSESESFAGVMRRIRPITFSVSEVNFPSFDLSNPKGMQFAISEAAAVSYSLKTSRRLGNMTVAGQEAHTARALRRRALAATLSETSIVSFTMSVHNRSFDFTVEQVDSQRFALNEIRRLERTVQEETQTIAISTLSVSRNLAFTLQPIAVTEVISPIVHHLRRSYTGVITAAELITVDQLKILRAEVKFNLTVAQNEVIANTLSMKRPPFSLTINQTAAIGNIKLSNRTPIPTGTGSSGTSIRTNAGSMPTYAYRPAIGGTSPFMRTRSNRRSRLWEGGTYFRSRDPGMQWNNVSIQLVDPNEDDDEDPPLGGSDLPGHEDEGQDGALIVTNHNTYLSENVEGPVDVVFLEQQLKWNDRIEIYDLTGTPRARYYSISWQINPPAPVAVELGPVTLGGLIHLPPYMSAKVTLRASEVTPDSVIVFKPRTKIYVLKSIPKESEVETGGESGGTSTETSYGYDPAELRTKVNEEDPWIEMLERSGSGEQGSGNTGEGGGNSSTNPPGIGTDSDKADVQDDGVDDVFLESFEDTYMEDGDGLPPAPNTERTGPSRAIIHINKGEKKNGEMGDVNLVYEWVGANSFSGSWKVY